MMTKERMQQAEMLISYFNAQAGTRYRCRNEKTAQRMGRAIDAADGDVRSVRMFMKEQIAGGRKDMFGILDELVLAYADGKKELEPVVTEPELTVKAEPQTSDAAGVALNMMGSIITELLAKTKLDDIKASVGEAMKNELRQFILDNYGPIERKVSVQLPDRKVELDGVVHNKFEQIVKFVLADEPVFLTGPAGSGKNMLCQQVAKACGLDFYFSNAVTQEYKLTGFTDAMGNFHESQFYKAFKNGGLFMLDEMDASIPEVLIILNAAIANRYFDFPAPIGYVKAHPDFRVIAAGNTFGNGADYDYVGRNQLDAASLDRFAMIRVDYDARIEESCANGDNELLQFCRKFRAATEKAGICTVVSYRAISRMAKLSSCMEPDELLDSCLVKSLELDDLKAIEDGVSGCGRYSAGFRKILAARAS